MHLGMKAVAHDPGRIDPADARHVVRSAFGATHPFQVLLACMRSIPATGLETIEAPVHLVFAGKDLVIPPALYSSYFVDRIPHAEVTTLEDLGHCPQVEEPSLVADLIRGTVAEARRRRARRRALTPQSRGSSLLTTLPVGLRGSSSRNTTARGVL